ncbi:MAG: potassium-transporting ATPase subunit B, partial [Hyphomicrobiales bacterium]
MAASTASAIASPDLLGRAVVDAFRKLDPRQLAKNPVIFVTEIVAVLVTVLFVRDVLAGNPLAFTGQIMAWLWFTVLFANFAEAVAEGRGRAQADSLRKART